MAAGALGARPVGAGRCRWRGFAAALLVAGVAAGAPAPARADEQPSILKAYNLDWIERVREDAWPQPKAQRPVICLLDTGVNVTPDTPADHPEGPIVARLAIDGRGGEAQGGAFEHLHGTQMASIIAAPRNDWGTVGVFPQARIVSVRVTVGDAIHITPANMKHGVDTCAGFALNQLHSRVGAVVMPESLYDQRSSDTPGWVTSAAKAKAVGAVFAAAVGNGPDAASVAPVAAEGVVSVAASDERGELCSFSPRVATVGILGPGCTTAKDSAEWPAGSSAATAAVGAVLGAMATRLPDSSPDERTQMLFGTSRYLSSGDRWLSGLVLSEALFGGLVAAPTVHQLPSPVAPSVLGALPMSPGVSKETEPEIRVWRPRIRAEWERGRLVVRRLTHRRTGRLVLRIARGKTTVRRTTQRPRLVVPLVKRPTRLSAWIESRQPGKWRSLTVRVGVNTR